MRLWKQNVLIILILILLVLCAVKLSHAGAGSFTIVGTAGSLAITSTSIDSINPDLPIRYAQLWIGYYYTTNTWRAMFKFPTIIDTLRTVVGSTHQIDSAMIRFVVGTAPSADDSQFVALYEIVRPWVATMIAADTCGVTWDSANATGDGAGGGTPAAWGTAGCKNTTTDVKINAEQVGTHDSLFLMIPGVADANDTITLWITGTSIVDTVNCQGYLLRAVKYGDNDGAASRSSLVNTTGKYPVLTVWYSDKAAPPAATTIPNYIHCPSGPGLRQSISGGSQIAHP
jgi:hypothetical protein